MAHTSGMTQMAHFHLDGTLVVAKLKRDLIGGGVYKDVTVRDGEGSERNVGTIMALDDMKPVMVPGTRGRFYFYDVAGTKGVYGARLIGGRAHACFPWRWEIMTAGMAVLNLLMALFWQISGSFAPLATVLGLACLVMAALFLRTRTGAMRRYRGDDACVPAAAQPSAADARI